VCLLGSVALVSVPLSCGFILDEAAPGPGFDHRVHLDEGELDCSDCHTSVEDEDDPGIPVLAQCLLCHDEESEAAKPESRRVTSLMVDGALVLGPRTALPDEVEFSHLAHVERGEDCATCHAGVETSEHPSTIAAVDMDACQDCHERESYASSEDCSSCHTRIDESWAPPSHERNWTRDHGRVSRMPDPGEASRCDLCHTQQSCDQCHFQEPPKDHTNFWRLRGHGIEARMEARSCATCHRSDYCQRCHSENAPLNHRGSFGGTRSNHCVTCHFPLRSQNCATCHQDLRGHDRAVPRGPGHTPSPDCRSCHGINAPFSHADNGDLCILCHR